MKTILTAAAFVLLATTAHAAGPMLPKEYHGQWCQNDEMTDNSQRVVDRCAAGELAVDRHGFGTEDSYCKLMSVRPTPSGKYDALITKFRCVNDKTREATTYHWQIWLYDDHLFMEDYK